MNRKVCPSCGCRYGRASTRCDIDGSALAPLEDPLRGRLLGGRYRIHDELGAGAMATVYDGVDERTRAPVAIKVPDPELLAEPTLRERFLREGRAGLSVRHPHVAATLDVGCEGDVHFLVMERLEGETLASRVSRGALPVTEAVSFARQIADALAALHAMGIVHRDVKPSNVFLDERSDPSRCVKLLDLGVAHAQVEDALTASKALLGSPRYMAPEQVRCEKAVAASDLYALGVVLFETLTGAAPFRGNDLAMRRAHVFTAAPRARSLRGDVPEWLDELVDVLLAKNPAQRPVSAAHVRDRLDALSREEPDGATRMVGASNAAQPATPDVSVDPARVAACHESIAALVAHWNALGPTLDVLSRIRALDAEMRRLALGLAQLDDGTEARRRMELSMALCDDERHTLTAWLLEAAVTSTTVQAQVDQCLHGASDLSRNLVGLREK